MNITISGHKHLSSVIGEDDFLDLFFEKKVDKWLSELSNLNEIARTEPHAAYCGFVHGFKHKLTYALRTTPGDAVLLSPLEDHIRSSFFPALAGKSAISDVERKLLALLQRLGGLGIIDFTQSPLDHYHASQDFCSPIINCIVDQEHEVNDSIYDERSQIKLKSKSAKKTKDAEIASSIDVPEHLTKTVELAKDKGSSSWLTTLPLEMYGFHLSKSEFRDAIALRYGWLPERLPSKYVCDETFTVEHALSSPRGAFPMIRHNEV